MLYNYLEYVSPADVDDIKRAYVQVGDKRIRAIPVEKDKAQIAQMYGKKSTLIASKIEPMALIPRASPEDSLFPSYRGFGDELMRSALRRIVDEV